PADPQPRVPPGAGGRARPRGAGRHRGGAGAMSPKKKRAKGGGLGFFTDQWTADDEVEDDVEVGHDAELARERHRLLLDTLRPYRGHILAGALAIIVSTGAVLAMPWLVERGIDRGIVPRHTHTLLVV